MVYMCAKCCAGFSQSQKFSSAVFTELYNSGSQTFMSRGPLLNLTGKYLIYRDAWVMQCHGKAT